MHDYSGLIAASFLPAFLHLSVGSFVPVYMYHAESTGVYAVVHISERSKGAPKKPEAPLQQHVWRLVGKHTGKARSPPKPKGS